MNAFNRRMNGRIGLSLLGVWLSGLNEFFALARSRRWLRGRGGRAM